MKCDTYLSNLLSWQTEFILEDEYKTLSSPIHSLDRYTIYHVDGVVHRDIIVGPAIFSKTKNKKQLMYIENGFMKYKVIIDSSITIIKEYNSPIISALQGDSNYIIFKCNTNNDNPFNIDNIELFKKASTSVCVIIDDIIISDLKYVEFINRYNNINNF